MKHVMIDLETMGNTPQAAPIAIGAVSFGIENGKWIVDNKHTFYKRINLQSCMDEGLKIDTSTLFWWMKQEETARAEFYDNEKEMSIKNILAEFNEWFKQIGGVYPWGNGSDFDIAIMNNAYNMTRFTAPWQFWNSRCFRTLKNLVKIELPKIEGIKHNALVDAANQATHACLIMDALKEKE